MGAIAYFSLLPPLAVVVGCYVSTAEVTNKVESMRREQVSRVAFSFQSALNHLRLPSHVPLRFSQFGKNTHKVADYSTLLRAGVMSRRMDSDTLLILSLC